MITEIERKALIDLRNRLQTGEVAGIHDWLNEPAKERTTTPRLFLDMQCWIRPLDGDLSGCIIGLCWHISDRQAFNNIMKSYSLTANIPGALLALALPHLSALDPQEQRIGLTPADAAHAITTFLATGHADWRDQP